jgi:hypothetical protein
MCSYRIYLVKSNAMKIYVKDIVDLVWQNVKRNYLKNRIPLEI